jgi:hypothetical protein
MPLLRDAGRCLERVISRRVLQLMQPADLADAAADEVQRVQVSQPAAAQRGQGGGKCKWRRYVPT